MADDNHDLDALPDRVAFRQRLASSLNSQCRTHEPHENTDHSAPRGPYRARPGTFPGDLSPARAADRGPHN
jgi:hypothetical protein